MRWQTVALAFVLAAWLAVSFAQQDAPPPAAPPAARTPPATAPTPPAPDRAEPDAAEAEPPARGGAVDDVFIPTEELQPDAAVTFPVDI